MCKVHNGNEGPRQEESLNVGCDPRYDASPKGGQILRTKNPWQVFNDVIGEQLTLQHAQGRKDERSKAQALIPEASVYSSARLCFFRRLLACGGWLFLAPEVNLARDIELDFRRCEFRSG